MQYDSLGELTIWGHRRCSDTRDCLFTSEAYPSCPIWCWAAPWSGSGFLSDLVKSLSKPGGLHNSRDAQKIHIFPLPHDSWSAHPFTVSCSWQLKRSHYWECGGWTSHWDLKWIFGNILFGNQIVWNPIFLLNSKGKCNRFKFLFFIFSFHSGNLKYIFNNLLEKKFNSSYILFFDLISLCIP